jgi:hypothetical protein
VNIITGKGREVLGSFSSRLKRGGQVSNAPQLRLIKIKLNQENNRLWNATGYLPCEYIAVDTPSLHSLAAVKDAVSAPGGMPAPLEYMRHGSQYVPQTPCMACTEVSEC